MFETVRHLLARLSYPEVPIPLVDLQCPLKLVREKEERKISQLGKRKNRNKYSTEKKEIESTN